jgi:hypothetical protein
MEKIRERVATDYADHRGLIFEVEPVDFARVKAVIGDLERTGLKSVDNVEDAAEVRRFLRILLYERGGAYLFTDSHGHPLDYYQPCLDIERSPAKWDKGSVPLWLMYYHLDKPRDLSGADKLWKEALHLVVVEVMGKSYAMDKPAMGERYIRYTESVRDRALRESRSKYVALEKIIKTDELSKLAKRWWKLEINLPL